MLQAMMSKYLAKSVMRTATTYAQRRTISHVTWTISTTSWKDMPFVPPTRYAPPKGALVHLIDLRIERHKLQRGDMQGYFDTLDVGLLDPLVFEEECYRTPHEDPA